MVWWIWVIIAIVLIVAEMLTLDLVLLMLAGGALSAALASELGVESFIAQAIIWAVVSLLLLAFLRRWMLDKLRLRTDLPETNAQGYIGKDGVTVTEVTGTGGRIKFRGEVWTARSLSHEAISNGTHVKIVEIDGATAVVEPVLKPVGEE
ncbi:NfeD family protein [Timonella sp. A28]|uniref:NfeD family protein n=1 Tax=Timonella sp. A28 TaxID=3442640 RepID=UPI003EB6A499